MLASHYRGPINYSLEQLEQADAALGRIMTALRDLPESAPAVAADSEYAVRFQEAMDDDFNTPEAIAVLQTLTREINTAKDAGDDARAAALGAELRSLAGVIGITVTPKEWFSSGHETRVTGRVQGNSRRRPDGWRDRGAHSGPHQRA